MKSAAEIGAVPLCSNEQILNLRRRIQSWFRNHGRDLPWRKTHDPYAVWVSEIMLQQTTTETVLGYYDRFLKRFPCVADLARADISEVLHYWEGLGYYRRAHLLHRAAGIIADEYGGFFPAERRDLEKLPGFGRYTVGAVLSFAFNRREPILEANTTRLHARILAVRGDLTAKESSSILWDFAEQILPVRAPGLFNQALIDLGRTVCVPRVPRCAECPCRAECRTALEGLQDQIPAKKKKTAAENRIETAWLIRRSFYTGASGDKKRFLFVRYPKYLRWGGLWDFPRFLLEGDMSPIKDKHIMSRLQEFLGTEEIFPSAELKVLNHIVTHYKIRLCFCDTEGQAKKGESFVLGDRVVSFAGGEANLRDLEYRWLTPDEASAVPLSSTGRKLVSFLRESLF